MSLDESINAYFVKTANSNESASDTLTNANLFEKALVLLKSHIPENNIRQIKASEGFALIASGSLTKKDVFIIDHFEGEFFTQLQQTKALIVGPSCLVSCVLQQKPIPLGISPVYTTAMRNLHVSATSISVSEKERIRVLILWMGGHYLQNLGRSATHLISTSIKSNKYEHATLNGIPVMHVDWVQNIWERSCSGDENVCATDAEFDKFRLPIFYGANITCTGLSSDKKARVMRIVNENGGTYHRAFRSQCVDIVITEQSATTSDKYKAALRFNKDILLPEWIFDSEEKGYALPTKGYVVRARKDASTPTKSCPQSADQTQLSEISRIHCVTGAQRMGSDMSTLDETVSSTLNASTASNANGTFVTPVAPSVAGVQQAKSSRNLLKKATTSNAAMHYRHAFDEISTRQAKKAGSFLDGCCVYLSGFLPDEREQLNRILNAGGATRFDEPNHELTHIIIGQMDDNEFRTWQKDGLTSTLHIVRLDWLLESIRAGHIVNEAIYRVPLPSTGEPDMPSPSSKRTLRSMNHSFKQPEKPEKTKKKLFATKDPIECNTPLTNESISAVVPIANSTEMPLDECEHNLLAQYSQEHEAAAGVPLPIPAPQATKTQSKATPPIAPSTPAAAAPPLPKKLTQAEIQAELTACGMSSIDFEKLDYFQGATVYVDKEHFGGEYYTQMISECEAAHGNLVSQTFSDPVDYAIVSFERTLDESTLKVKARYIVTELYVECCMRENKLVPIEYYHNHVPHTADSMPLKDMTIVISVYSGLERDFIDSIAKLLGAKVNKTFMKKEKPLLVCSEAEGSKYEGAIKWGYPIVNSNWLVQCAATGTKLPYRDYLVGDSPEDFPGSPNAGKELSTKKKIITPTTPIQPLNNDDTDVPIENEIMLNKKTSSATSTTSTTTPTEYTPLRNKRVSELVGGVTRHGRNSCNNSPNAANTPESPHTPINNFARATYNFDFMEQIAAKMGSEEERQCVREVIEEMRCNQTPELERIRRQACTPLNGKVRQPTGIPDFCLTPEYHKRMADDFERRWRLPTKKLKPNTPIDEIRRRVMRITCETLGIPYEGAPDEGTSKSGNESNSTPRSHAANELSTQRTNLKTPQIVTRRKSTVETTPILQKSPSTTGGRTLFTPVGDQNKSITPRASTSPGHNNSGNTSDTFVPNTQSPVGISGMGERASLGRSTINFDKISFEETAANATTTNRPSIISNTTALRTTTTAATSSPEIKQIQDYLKSCESRRHSLKRTHTSNANENVDDIDADVQYVQPFDSEQFGVGTEQMVGWQDPADCSARRRSRLSPGMQYQGTPCFSISCSDTVRNELIEKIVQLGGVVCENLTNYDPECTHFVCERPNRGEKMLGCIASGKWILSTKYIDECHAKEVFIDEELFEWGNTKALNLPQLATEEQLIASAAHRWRKELCGSTASNGKKTGAFSGFRALLSMSERNVDAIKTVLKAGSGEIIEAKSPFGTHNNANEATHCFVDVKKAPLSAQDYRFLKDHEVQILSQMYINSYLMNGQGVDKQRFILEM